MNVFIFYVFSDLENWVVCSFGFVYLLFEEICVVLCFVNKVFFEINGDDSWEFLVLLIYVVIGNGCVIFVYIDVDYI